MFIMIFQVQQEHHRCRVVVFAFSFGIISRQVLKNATFINELGRKRDANLLHHRDGIFTSCVS